MLCAVTVSLRRLTRAVLLSALASLVLSTHVFGTLHRIRVKVVQAPVTATAGHVRVSLTGLPALKSLQAPFALIARLDTGSSAAARFSIAADGAAACERQLSGGRRHRVDCAVVGWDAAAEHEITVSGPPTAWALEYLELATHHGNTSGPFELVVLPGGSRHFTRVAPGWAVVAWLVLTAALLVPAPRRLPRWVLLSSRVLEGAAVVLWVLIVTSPWLSAYFLVVPVGTFVRLLGLLFLGPAYAGCRWLCQPGVAVRRQWVLFTRSVLVGLLVLGVYGTVVGDRLRESYQGNYSGFLMVSARMFDRNPLLNTRADVRQSLVLDEGGGYDGQFMYFAAFDPFLRAFHDRPTAYRTVMDGAPYRYGRIGFSLLTRLLSAGRWQWFPVTMVWIVVGSLCLCAMLLAWTATANGQSPAIGALVVLVPGFWQSVQTGLPEPLAAAMLIGGCFCLLRGWWVRAGLLFAASLLVRETGVLAVGTLVVASLLTGRRREALMLGLISAAPLLLWRLYVAWILHPAFGVEALISHPPDLGWPLAGVRDLWLSIAQATYFPGVPELSRAGIVYPVLLVCGCALAAVLVIRRPNPLSVAALLYGILAICLNFEFIWVHVGNAQRGTYELFVMLALSSAGSREYPSWLRNALRVFWGASAAYIFLAGFDALFIRSSLGLSF